MRKIVLAVLTALCCGLAAYAVPAWPGLFSYTQPDGSVIRIRLRGDEFCHWVTDASGQVVELDADGFYRPASRARLEERRSAARIRRAAANSARRMGPARAGVAGGRKHFLVILVEFSDVSFGHTQAEFEALLNEPGYSVNGGTGSARDFYYENSHGAFEPVFDVYGPVTLAKSQAYYGGNDEDGNDLRPQYAVKAGCEGLDDVIDFSQYDNDNDGEVDLVFMYYAGKGEADRGGADCIWPHQWSLLSGGINLTLDGKRVDNYACTNEIVSVGELKGKLCGIGTACHEFGHAMGLPDFYDTDYDDYNGEAGGLYEYSTMCSGSYNNGGRTPPYFNIEERIMLGWLDESVYREFGTSGDYVLPGVDDEVVYRAQTDMDGEYFVYECRSKTGWDRYVPEAGLIVYHVDKSGRNVGIVDGNGSPVTVTARSLWDNWEQYNSINENGSHPCFYVVPAGDPAALNYDNVKFAFPGIANARSFTATSWNGVESDVKLSSISYLDNTVTLHADVPASTLNYNIIDNPGNGTYAAGSSFALNLVTSEAQPVSNVSWYLDDEPVSGSSVTLSAGTHVIEAHLTLESGETKIVDLTVVAQ